MNDLIMPTQTVLTPNNDNNNNNNSGPQSTRYPYLNVCTVLKPPLWRSTSFNSDSDRSAGPAGRGPFELTD